MTVRAYSLSLPTFVQILFELNTVILLFFFLYDNDNGDDDDVTVYFPLSLM